MDWNQILNQVLAFMLPALGSILTAALSYAAIKIKNTLETKATDETKSMIINKIVAYIDQTMRDAANSDKFHSAMAIASEWLSERNIDVPNSELKILIESAVNQAHAAFNNNVQYTLEGEFGNG